LSCDAAFAVESGGQLLEGEPQLGYLSRLFVQPRKRHGYRNKQRQQSQRSNDCQHNQKFH
jgi:hypothetical protein